MLKLVANLISVIFHPLLILTYMLVLLMLINPYLFGAHSISGNIRLILLVFLSTFVIPAFAVLMMRLVGFISSFQMEDRKERIGPYIVTGMFYMWMFRNLLANPDIPSAYSIFVLGATIGLFISFFINNFQKISAHAVGMGGLLGMVMICTFSSNISYGDFLIYTSENVYRIGMNSLLMVIILLAGVVGTSRLLLDAHNPQQLYGGYLVGIASQYLALAILT